MYIGAPGTQPAGVIPLRGVAIRINARVNCSHHQARAARWRAALAHSIQHQSFSARCALREAGPLKRGIASKAYARRGYQTSSVAVTEPSGVAYRYGSRRVAL